MQNKAENKHNTISSYELECCIANISKQCPILFPFCYKAGEFRRRPSLINWQSYMLLQACSQLGKLVRSLKGEVKNLYAFRDFEVYSVNTRRINAIGCPVTSYFMQNCTEWLVDHQPGSWRSMTVISVHLSATRPDCWNFHRWFSSAVISKDAKNRSSLSNCCCGLLVNLPLSGHNSISHLMSYSLYWRPRPPHIS